MPSRAMPGIGLRADWNLGEDGWKDEMDTNLRSLSVLAGQQVDDIVAAEPGAPAEGDIVILDETHATKPNQIAVYDEAAWRYIVPIRGVSMLNLANGRRYEFNGTIWTYPRIPTLVIETVSGATYDLVADDADKHKRFTNAAAVVTVSAGEFSPGDRIRITDVGGGLTLDDDGGLVTLNSRDNALTSAGAMAIIEIECVAADEFDVMGDLVA